MHEDLSGKVAFVTGSGRGLGRRMTERLAKHGADVAIHDIDRTAHAKHGNEAADRYRARPCRHPGHPRWGRHRRERQQANPDTSLDISFADIQVLTNNNLTGSMLVC